MSDRLLRRYEISRCGGGANSSGSSWASARDSNTMVDGNGHGDAVSQIITALCPTADIFPLRVLGPISGTGPSYQVLAGLSLALFSGDFDIVNASLTTGAAAHKCENTFGRSVEYLVRMGQANAKNQLPIVVAAAGNGNPNQSGYPGVLPGAVVGIALEADATGQLVRASYNSTTPLGPSYGSPAATAPLMALSSAQVRATGSPLRLHSGAWAATDSAGQRSMSTGFTDVTR